MKTAITKKQYEEIYELLNSVEILDFDCGTLCGAACCTHEGTEEMGIYLLPGEEAVHEDDHDWLDFRIEKAEEHYMPESWSDEVHFVRCKTPPFCPREKRPIQCRTFPLAPHIDSDGELTLIYNDMELPYKCPLIEEAIPLNFSHSILLRRLQYSIASYQDTCSTGRFSPL